MEYLEQFTVIDKNRDGIISRRDLFKYALSIGEDLSMVDRWLRLFDTNDKGIITIEDVSRTLGVPPPKFYDERYNRRLNGKFESSNDVFHQAAAKFRSTEDITRYSQSSLTSTENLSIYKRSYSTDNVPSDYHNLTVNNSWQLNDEPLFIEYSYEKIKEKLNQLIEIAIKKQIDIQTIPQFIAIALEKEYGRNWHVIVGPYKAGCAVTHLIGRFSNAQYASYHVIAFQTLDL
ncbi:unnamed protein product [Schistosoma margrebowiei]|uniref:EF-hand domain-containing protein n=1 Tax=Schistosoma margrebowiei TaxID=48269 RepID=A0AA84ZV24_9TREM|nr:unnamed protein product [Schistosoma margrebowiei]